MADINFSRRIQKENNKASNQYFLMIFQFLKVDLSVWGQILYHPGMPHVNIIILLYYYYIIVIFI